MSESVPANPLKCPVCGARFRGSATCSRCGTDLAALMRIAARAWAARKQCRAALEAGDLPAAVRWDAAAKQLQRMVG
jgi:hypothetical protein